MRALAHLLQAQRLCERSRRLAASLEAERGDVGFMQLARSVVDAERGDVGLMQLTRSVVEAERGDVGCMLLGRPLPFTR